MQLEQLHLANPGHTGCPRNLRPSVKPIRCSPSLSHPSSAQANQHGQSRAGCRADLQSTNGAIYARTGMRCSALTVPKIQCSQPFFYDGVIFDMDGTLTESHIDFADMRQRTGIRQGDLFTVMESWWDPTAIHSAMRTILDIEAEAAKSVKAKEGLIEILSMLRDRQVPVALVTRNTHASVNAFLELIGPSWASLFQIVLTREFQFVKPDKRLLLHVAAEWGVDPSQLLMVGDSLEDIETGNAAGCATCLVAGGGNEKPGAAPTKLPPGAVPTFTVQGLGELSVRLVEASQDLVQAQLSMLEANLVHDPPRHGSWEEQGGSSSRWSEAPQGSADSVALGWPARVAVGEQVLHHGAPPPGLAFLDWLAVSGALMPGACSFPVMGEAAGGLATCEMALRGERVLHLGCGAAALTKLLASQGMRVMGIDVDVVVAQQRGLTAVAFSKGRRPLSTGSVTRVLAEGQGGQHLRFDVALLFREGELPGSEGAGPGSSELHLGWQDQWWGQEALLEIHSVLSSSGKLCSEVSLPPSSAFNPALLVNSINSSGLFTVDSWQVLPPRAPGMPQQLRLVAKKC